MKNNTFVLNFRSILWYAIVACLFLIIGCVNPTDTDVESNMKKAAKFEIIDEDQDEYDVLDEWSALTVTYTIKNTGNVTIDYYEVTFKVTLKDGENVKDRANGTDIPTGDKTHQKETVIITNKKQYDEVEIIGYELKNVAMDDD